MVTIISSYIDTERCPTVKLKSPANNSHTSAVTMIQMGKTKMLNKETNNRMPRCCATQVTIVVTISCAGSSTAAVRKLMVNPNHKGGPDRSICTYGRHAHNTISPLTIHHYCHGYTRGDIKFFFTRTTRRIPCCLRP